MGLSNKFTLYGVPNYRYAIHIFTSTIISFAQNEYVMADSFVAKEKFEKINFTERPLVKGEYEDCSFIDCIFSSADLSGYYFSKCSFDNCEMSMVTLTKTTLSNVQFSNCKLLGIQFSACNQFLLSFSFKDCQLNFSSFYRLKINGTTFTNCNLEEADMVGAELNKAVFDNCNLTGTSFENTNLEGADLRTAIGYSIDPEINKIKQARFSIYGLAGLLHKYHIEVE